MRDTKSKAIGKRSGKTNMIIRIFTVLAAIIGILLIMLLPKNPLFTLPLIVRILICVVFVILVCLILLFMGRKGIFITSSIILALLFFTSIGVYSVGNRYYSADLPQYRETVFIMADNGHQGDILIVFHPGNSTFTTNSVTAFGEALAAEGYNVEIATANPELKPNFLSYDLVVLASNIYNRKVRPPIIDFVENNDFANIKVFTLFIGNHRKRVREELDLFMPYLEEANAIHIEHFKYPKNDPELPVDELVQCAKEVVASLR